MAALLAASGLIAIALILWVGGGGVLTTVRDIRPGWLAVALGLQTSFMLLWSARWALVVRARGHRIPREMPAILFAGAFFSNITPFSKGGGEPIRAYLLGKANGTSFEDGMASVVVDRVFDMVPFIPICLITLALGAMTNLGRNSLLFLLILFGLLAATCLSAVMILLATRREAGTRLVLSMVDRLGPLIARFRPPGQVRRRVADGVDRFYVGVRSISENRKLMIINLLLSFGLWIVVILRTKCVFMALGSGQSLLLINFVQVACVFASFAPLLPGGLGTTEVTMVALFIGLGVSREMSGSAVIVDRMVSFWFVTLVGAVSSVQLGYRLKLLGQIVRT